MESDYGLDLIANKNKLAKKKSESKAIVIYDRLSKLNPIIYNAMEQNPIIIGNLDKFFAVYEKKIKEIIKHYGIDKSD